MDVEVIQEYGNYVQVAIYSVFILMTYLKLRKCQQSLDTYMYLTLLLIGLAILTTQLSNIIYLITKRTLPTVADIIFSRFPNQILEKAGIYFDIARLSIIIITLKQSPNLN